jgi:hypothetical protein
LGPSTADVGPVDGRRRVVGPVNGRRLVVRSQTRQSLVCLAR